MERKNLASYCFVNLDNEMFFPAIRHNALFKWDMEKRWLEFLGKLSNGDIVLSQQYNTIIEKDKKLYLAPANAKEIVCYDIKEKYFLSLKIDYSQRGCIDNTSKFFGAVSFGDYIYFIPSKLKSILRLNVKNLEISYIDNWCSRLENLKQNQYIVDKNGYVLNGKYLFLNIWNSKMIVCIDLENGRIQERYVGNDNIIDSWSGICIDNKNIWLVSSDGKYFAKYHWETDEIIYYVDSENNVLPSVDGAYVRLVDMGEKIFAPAYRYRKSRMLDKKTGRIENVIWKEEFFSDSEVNTGIHYNFVEKIGTHEMLMYCSDNQSYMIVDTETGNTKSWKISISNEMELILSMQDVDKYTKYNTINETTSNTIGKKIFKVVS